MAEITVDDMARLITEVTTAHAGTGGVKFFRDGTFDEGVEQWMVEMLREIYPDTMATILENLSEGESGTQSAMAGEAKDPIFHLVCVMFTSGFHFGWEAHKQFRPERDNE